MTNIFQPSWYKPPAKKKANIFGPSWYKGAGSAPKAPSAPQVPYTPGASSADSTANPTSANKSYDYLSDPNLILDQAAITQRYGTETSNINLAHSQDQIALNRAYSILGADNSGNLKNSQFDAGGVKNEGSYYNDIQGARVAANKAGLAGSGIEGQNIGDIKVGYANKIGELGQGFKNAEDARAIQTRDVEGTYGVGGIESRKAVQNAKDRMEAAAGQQALIDAINGSGNSAGGTAAPPAQQMNPLPGLGMLPLSTGFAGLDPNKKYKQATNGKLMVQNSNGTWRYV